MTVARAPPLTLARWVVADGVREDLQGRLCVSPKCNEETSHLGRMVGVRTVDVMQEQVVLDITKKTVCYRCRCCRRPYAVTWGQAPFKDLGHGSYSLTYQVLAFLGWCEDKSLTQVARDLNVHETDVREWYDKAEAIVCADMPERQIRMKFGCRGTETTCVEADEACIQSWTVCVLETLKGGVEPV